MKNKLLPAAAVLACAAVCYIAVLAAVYGIAGLTPVQAPEDGYSRLSALTAYSHESEMIPACGECSAEEIEEGLLIEAVDMSHYVPGSLPAVSNISGKDLDIQSLMSAGMPRLKPDGSIQVYIYHTHTTESYAKSDLLDPDAVYISHSADENMIAVGEAFAEVLRSCGVGVIHDTEYHDASYNLAYKSSRSSVISVLSQNSGIKYIIDIHRDDISGGGSQRKTMFTAGGVKSAQIMLVVGAGHSGWRSNMSAALGLQAEIDSLYPGLARPVYLSGGEYNQSTFGGALLIECGAAGNTLSEALTAAKLTAEALFKAAS